MENLPTIKWHAQKLCSLLEQEPNNAMCAKVLVDLETIFLNSHPFKDIDAVPPAVTDEKAV